MGNVMFRFLKKQRARRAQAVEKKVSQWNAPLEERKIRASLEDNIAVCKQLFSDMDIIRYRRFQTEGETPLECFLVFCDGMVHSQILNSHIVKPLMSLKVDVGSVPMESLITGAVPVSEASLIDSFRCVVESVSSGDTVLFIHGCQQAAVLNTKQFNVRAIDEPDNEKVLVGPREGFTESLMQNLSQLVRRVHTNAFKTKMMTLGRLTKTPVCVCYLEGLVDKSILDELLRRLGQIDIDGVLDANYITELVREHRMSPFRSMGYTERPDAVVGKLLEGRIAIFVDGSPMALTVPYLFIENFQSSEDYYLSFYYTSFARLLRIGAFLLTVTIPGLYIAVVAFHQEMLPLRLLIRIALERQSVPLPAAMEAVVMLIVFDILRETGIRMPSNIGQALSIVGALVIGQAAVEASLVAAPMIIVVAATGITSLLVPKLNAPITLWRFVILALSTSFGFFGFTIGLALMMIHTGNMTSMGVEQFSLQGSFHFQAFKDILIRAPWPMMIKRPDHLTKNKIRQKGGQDHG
ncbi:MAG: spore germination protein [Candidatus Limiplasma sp.]|nr:spore germination protein [Candidatus Limiplasma sp.]